MLKLQFLCNFSITIPTIEKIKTQLFYSRINSLQSQIDSLTTQEFANFYIYIIFCKDILEGKGALLAENARDYCDIVGRYLQENPSEIPQELKLKQEEEKYSVSYDNYIIPKQKKKKVKQEKKVIDVKENHINKDETTGTTTATSQKQMDFDQNCVFEFPNLGNGEFSNKKIEKEVEFSEDFPKIASEPPVMPIKKQKQQYKIGKNWEINNVNPLLKKNTVVEEFPSLVKQETNNNNTIKEKQEPPIQEKSPPKLLQKNQQEKKKEDDNFLEGYYDTNNNWISLNQNDILQQQVRQEQFKQRKEQTIGRLGKGKNKKVLLKGGFV